MTLEEYNEYTLVLKDLVFFAEQNLKIPGNNGTQADVDIAQEKLNQHLANKHILVTEST